MTQSTIGFFGDSFCADSAGWIDQLGQLYRITHLGQEGASIGDTILNQWFREARRGRTPDIAVFVWTTHARLYHPEVRNITPERALSSRYNSQIWQAARDYYMNLYDDAWAALQAEATLQQVDQRIKASKIIHMGSFTTRTWVNGVSIEPALVTISQQNRTPQDLKNDTSPNHMDTLAKNNSIYRAVRQAIDEYSPGKIITIDDCTLTI